MTSNLQDLQLKHHIDVSLSNGNSEVEINIPTSDSRGGFQPSLALSYSSFAKNSIFGIGWSLSGLPFISIDTSKGLPKYDGDDNFAFNGSSKVIPFLIKKGASWKQRIDENTNYFIFYYRSVNEVNFVRFEKWVKKSNGVTHWRTRSTDNTISIYGKNSSNKTKIYDPKNTNNEFIWLLEAQYDDNGNAVLYQYVEEDDENINKSNSYEFDRLTNSNVNGFSQKYPHKIVYGNTKPLFPDTPPPSSNKWQFEIVFDFGQVEDKPYTSNTATQAWSLRKDPFSIYSPGFEIRSYRLCHRILMYHNFSELAGTSSLVGILNCEYNEKSTGTILASTSYTGVRRDLTTGAYTEKRLSPLLFTYTEVIPDLSFNSVTETTSQNIPAGLNQNSIQFVDLFNEGLSGILLESNNAWYYKSNEGGGNFRQQETIINKPSQGIKSLAMGDFDNDGNLNLYSLQGRTAGYYEYDRTAERWSGFTALKQIPQAGNVRLIDTNGDGLPDLVTETDEKITCYKSKGKKGFDKPYEFSKPRSNGVDYTPMIGNNLELDYFQADMSGDGLPDQVQIKNGKVIYYPNYGNGRYGSAVVMENPPSIDFDNTFDASRIRLYDLDGSGTNDIIYIGNGEIRYWYNASGNSFTEEKKITGLPYIDNISNARIIDFLGDGTPCLVWSSSLNHQQYSSIQYLPLASKVKPRLLISLDNSMGQRVELEYSSSAKHYLRDKASDKPWISKLPSHFTVVDKKIIEDKITNSKLVTQYKYKDGYFDSNEKSFATFGLVEKYDSEVFNNASTTHNNNYAQASCVRTWFHNGMFGLDDQRKLQFYAKDSKQSFLPQDQLEINEALEAKDFIKAFQTLRGREIRQELYEVGIQGELTDHPFHITQSSYKIKKLQPSREKETASYFAYQSEKLEAEYEQNADDPKTSHHLTIGVDNYGNTQKELSISYARRSTIPNTLTAQKKDYITGLTHSYENIDTAESYSTGVLFEWKNYEINHITHQADTLISVNEAVGVFDNLIQNAIDFDKPLSQDGTSEARLSSWNRTFFWNDNLDDKLPLGQVGEIALAHHEETACFNRESGRDNGIASIIPPTPPNIRFSVFGG